jgi:hypothetical protein
MNAFDGALTIMGVVIGAHFSGVIDAHIVITAGIAQQRGHGHLRHQRCLSGREGGEEERLKEAGDVMPYFFVPQISMQSAFYTSLVLSLSILFTLGYSWPGSAMSGPWPPAFR